MPDAPLFETLVVLSFLLAGLVKGLVGFGLPPIAIGLLSLAMTPAEAAALMIAPSLATNVWQMLAGRRLPSLVRRLWPMMLAISLGTWVASGVLTGSGGGTARVALGGALAAYALLGLGSLRIVVPGRAEPWLSPAMGGLTGIVAGATGIFTIPAVPYLQALGLERDALVQALGLSFTVSTLALAGALAGNGALGTSAGASLLALVAAVAGMALGQRGRARIDQDLFRRCFFWGLLVLGGHLLVQGVV